MVTGSRLMHDEGPVSSRAACTKVSSAQVARAISSTQCGTTQIAATEVSTSVIHGRLRMEPTTRKATASRMHSTATLKPAATSTSVEPAPASATESSSPTSVKASTAPAPDATATSAKSSSKDWFGCDCSRQQQDKKQMPA